jgi:DNA-3-methyladenine glycosylase II
MPPKKPKRRAPPKAKKKALKKPQTALQKKLAKPKPARARKPAKAVVKAPPKRVRTDARDTDPAPSLYAGSADVPFDALAAHAHLHDADPVLSRLISRVHARIGPFGLQPQGHEIPPFQALTEAILHQQVTGKAAAAILGRLRATFGDGAAFPSPLVIANASDDALRAVGVSRGKAKALRDLAAKSIDGTVPNATVLATMEEERILERLTKVHGIGEWTVHMLLIFRLGRPDVLPVGDYGIRKGFARTFRTKDELATPGEIKERAERWRPYRTVASWYLWRALELK